MKLVISTKVLIYCALLGALIVIAGVVLGFRVFPKFVEEKVWENSVLKENTTQWSIFMKIPFPFQIKLYFFHVRNPDEILQGAKPVVEEIGPYVYKLNRWKSDIEWNSDEISYYDYTKLEFDEEASGVLSDEDTVTILNLPFNALIATVEDLTVEALATVNTVLPEIFGNHNGLFTTAKVKDLLFEGTRICEDGGGGDFAAEMICNQFKDKAKDAKPMNIVGKAIDYAYLRYKNHTHLGRFTVNSGNRVKERLNDLVKFENATRISYWKGGNESKCNQIRGTTAFRPYVTPNMTFEVFGEDICRVLSMEYKDVETVDGVKGYRYAVPKTAFDTPKENSPDSCFCVNRSRDLNGDYPGCLGNGLLDMTTCMGAPVLLSFPHLLYADKQYLSSIKGLKPEEKLHDTYVVLEPTSGAPLKMAKRVQFNMVIRPVQDIVSIENVTNALMPIFWIEESMTLNGEMLDTLRTQLLSKLKILEIIKWGLIGLGSVTIAASTTLMIYKN